MAGLAVPGVMQGQVTNYSLKLTSGGSVMSGPVNELDNTTSYTVQFWICPALWTEGAEVFSRGTLKAQLYTEGTVRFTVGATTIDASSSLFAVGQWAQVTLVCDEGSATVLVNNSAVATGTLGAVPAENANLVLGTGFVGRIDEFRLWRAALEDKFVRFWNNTLNRYAPQWDDLVVYYKFDQNLCDNVVDYKTALTSSPTSNHHAAFQSGASREAVTDNSKLPYLLAGAYTANERFFDRMIEREKYLLANDLIILGIQSYADGHLKYVTPNNHATITGGTHMAEYEGRKGVMSLDGTGKIAAGADALTPSLTAGVDKYTFHTWIYLDEWTEGAYIFQKESADLGSGFSIRLGEAATKQVIVRVNGKNFVNTNAGLTVGKWVHFGLSIGTATSAANTFTFVYDGVASEADETLSDASTTYVPTNYATLEANIGENLKAKLDEFTIWNVAYGAAAIYSNGNNYLMPGIAKQLVSYNMQRANTLYLFDDASNPGYDSYSQDNWLAIMKSAYEGYRGYKIRISVKSHTNWNSSTIADAAKRAIFAADLAKLVEGYDGAELDLEWALNSTQWNNYNELIKAIKAVFPADKSFMVSNHAIYYHLSPSIFPLVDGFTIQQYGPRKTWSFFANFQSSTNTLVNYGYPKEKLYLAYATTTSRSYTGPDNDTFGSGAVKGIKDGFMEGDYVEKVEGDSRQASDGLYYYFTGPMQVYNRAKYVVDNNYQGLFFWDMGNDNPINHKYVLAKYSNYGLNSNVDTLITEVELPVIVTPTIDSAFIAETESTISDMSYLVGFVSGYKADNLDAIRTALDTYKADVSNQNKNAVSLAISTAQTDLVAFTPDRYYRIISGAPVPWAGTKEDGIYRSIWWRYTTDTSNPYPRLFWGLTDETSVDYLWLLGGTMSALSIKHPNLDKYLSTYDSRGLVANAYTQNYTQAVDGEPALFKLKLGASSANFLQAYKPYLKDGGENLFNGTNPDGHRWYFKQVDTIRVNITGTYAAINLPFAVQIPEGVTAYYGKTDNGASITLSAIESIIPANTPVIVAADASSTEGKAYAFAISYDNAGTAISGNLLSGSLAPKTIEANSYVLGNTNGAEGLYPTTTATELAQNKAYFVPATYSDQSYISFDFEGVTTISSATADGVTEAYYDLNGRRVTNPKSGGIYVTASGKKVIFK